MRRIVESTVEPNDIHPELAAYQSAVTSRCPYLSPSMSRRLTSWSSFQVDRHDSPEVLAVLVEAAESLRVARRSQGPLVCRNIALRGPIDISSAKAVMDWPAWIVRNLYAPVQIMVGRFWIGEERIDKHGRAVPRPPISFVSLRHSFVAQDARFLSTFPVVAQRLAESDDDGRDVLAPWLGKPLSVKAVREGYSDLVRLFPAERKVNA